MHIFYEFFFFPKNFNLVGQGVVEKIEFHFIKALKKNFFAQFHRFRRNVRACMQVMPFLALKYDTFGS